MPNHMVKLNLLMVCFEHYVNSVLIQCLALNLVLNLVVDLGLDFECAIYCLNNDICDMESMEFERHLVVLVDFDFD